MKIKSYLNSVCAGFPSPASDYLEGEITDREILSEFLGFSLTDDDYLDKDREKYWNDTSAVWVSNVLNISEQDLKTLRHYGILY